MCFCSMAENKESHLTFVEVMDPSDINFSLLCESENLPDVILINPSTPPRASFHTVDQHQLWMNSESRVSSHTGNSLQLHTGLTLLN